MGGPFPRLRISALYCPVAIQIQKYFNQPTQVRAGRVFSSGAAIEKVLSDFSDQTARKKFQSTNWRACFRLFMFEVPKHDEEEERERV